MAIDLEFIQNVNRSQIEKLDRVGKELLSREERAWSELFSQQVRQCEAAVIHTYQIIARAAVMHESPEEAANLWRYMSEFCDQMLEKLKSLRSQYPECGTPELYDLTLDYKLAADKRYEQNLLDAACLKTPTPAFLLPKAS